MNTEDINNNDDKITIDDVVFQHLNNLLKIYDNMIEESKCMNGDLLSNDYIYSKPVFQQIFQFILSSVETNKEHIIKEDSDEDYLSE
jgi:hypothetical protein